MIVSPRMPQKDVIFYPSFLQMGHWKFLRLEIFQPKSSKLKITSEYNCLCEVSKEERIANFKKPNKTTRELFIFYVITES